jgi:hypothetical protein
VAQGRIRNSKVLALLLKSFARVYIRVYQRTDGRLGAKLLWFPARLSRKSQGAHADSRRAPRSRRRDATEGERIKHWPQLTRIYPPYKGYREAADRVIPLVVCEPVLDSSSRS